MKRQKTLIIFSLGFILAMLVLFGSTAQPAQAESTHQVTTCGEILVDAANCAGIVTDDAEWFYDHLSGIWICDVEFNMDNDTRNESVRFSIEQTSEFLDYWLDMNEICGEDKRCHPTSFHGLPAFWREGGEFTWLSSPTGGNPQIGEMGYHFFVKRSRYAPPVDQSELIVLAEALSSAAEGKLPGAEVPPAGPVQSNDCAGITPEDLRAGGVAVLACRLHCDPNSMSDDELQACINQNSGQSDSVPPVIPVDPGDEPPVIPVDPGSEPPLVPDNPDTYIPPVDSPPGTNPFSVAWDSLPAGLIRNPLIPIVGGLTGTALAWLYSQMGRRPIPGSLQPKDVPPIDNANAQGLYWSERPWDVAGPGYVSKAEFEKTKGLLEQGYKWMNGGWQTTEGIQQSNQLQQNNRAAVAREQAAREQAAREQAARENAAREAQREQERQKAIRAQREKLDKLEAESQKNQYKSPINVELGAEAGNSGALSSSEMDQGAGLKVGVYKEAYYDADDKVGDLNVGGYDIGGWKADVQIGKAQAGGGFGYDKKTGNISAGGSFEISSGQLTGEGVVGNEYLGATSDGQIDGPKAEGFLGYKDGSVGVSIGGSLVSVETGMGLNVAGANVGVRGGISFGLEFGLTLGKETEIKIGPFKLGLSFGLAKTAQ